MVSTSANGYPVPAGADVASVVLYCTTRDVRRIRPNDLGAKPTVIRRSIVVKAQAVVFMLGQCTTTIADNGTFATVDKEVFAVRSATVQTKRQRTRGMFFLFTYNWRMIQDRDVDVQNWRQLTKVRHLRNMRFRGIRLESVGT